MAVPSVKRFTEVVYRSLLPIAYEEEYHGYPMLYYVDGLAEMWQEVEEWVRDTPDGKPGWSLLLDIDRAPDKALPWLGQFVGTQTPLRSHLGSALITPPNLDANLPNRIADWAGIGTTYYVDSVTGSDARSEVQAQNPATPWATLAKFKATYVKPAVGHIRCLVKGTHRAAGTATGVQATLELWGLGARAPDATHILIFEAWDPAVPPTIEEPSYTGGTPQSAERHAIWLDDATASFTRFRNLRIVQNTASTNQQQAFRIDSNVTDVDISRNFIRGWKSAATSGTDRSQGIFCDGTRIHIYDNDINANGDAVTEAPGASHSVYLSASAVSCVVVQNKLRDNRNGFGLQFFAAGGGAGHIVAHNVMSNNLMSGLVVDGSTWTVEAYNNIIYDNDEWAITVRNGATVTARNNLTFGNTFVGTLGDGYNVGTGGGTFTVSDRIVGDPVFVDYTARDFHLSVGSPAFNAGRVGYTPPYDFEGNVRGVPTLGPYAAPEDAFEAEIESDAEYFARVRDTIRAMLGQTRGTKQAMINAAFPFLTGTKTIVFREREPDSAYRLTVITYTDETPDPARVHKALLDSKPAAIQLTYIVLSGQTWLQLRDTHIDWQDVRDSYATWEDVRDNT